MQRYDNSFKLKVFMSIGTNNYVIVVYSLNNANTKIK